MNSQPTDLPRARARPKIKSRGWWLRQLHTWHWISAAVALAAMLLFSFTGITLNHASAISASPKVTTLHATLPPQLLRLIKGPPPKADAPLPEAIAAHLAPALGLDAQGKAAEWSDDDVYVAMPRPGGDAWLSVARRDGAVKAEITNRGWISYLNDLHKGRNTGNTWFWFIDLFAAACVLFTLTGLVLLFLHARHRRSTWPLVGLGLAIPVLVAILFIH